jgi:hypothetical protein
MNVSGISVTKAGRYAICCIDQFSDEIKDIIRDELNIICYGQKTVSEDDQDFYSYQATVSEFMARYDSKSKKIKLGMLGELLAHVLIGRIFPNLEIISPFFNKEERSIRKGFDLNYLGENKDCIWYSEVKSGERQKRGIDAKNKILLDYAKKDLQDKLGGKRRSLWESAINDVAICVATNSVKSVSDLLKQDLVSLQANANTTKNAILVSVLFHDTKNKVSQPSVSDYADNLIKTNIFSSAIIVSIQKSTFDKMERFLHDEAAK